MLVKVLAPGFFAHQNTRNPGQGRGRRVALNLALTIGLMRFLAHVGVALALSLSGWMQALALLVLLRRHGHFRLDRRARGNIPRIAAAALGMAGDRARAADAARAGAGRAVDDCGSARWPALIAAGVIVVRRRWCWRSACADWRELRGQLLRPAPNRLDPLPTRPARRR